MPNLSEAREIKEALAGNTELNYLEKRKKQW